MTELAKTYDERSSQGASHDERSSQGASHDERSSQGASHDERSSQGASHDERSSQGASHDERSSQERSDYERSESQRRYDPTAFEADIYAKWEASGAFAPTDRFRQPADGGPGSDADGGSKAKPFCIIAPPPNANGALHIGHAVFVTLQDIMIRYHRMKGDATLWLPGFDHAGFETQVVYEKKLEKAGRSRFQLPRDQLYQEMYDFTQANLVTMLNQLKKLGASMDWSRQKFTLDPEVVKLVYQNFKKLYDDGLVYRSARPVNWCTKHQTSLSDLEVRYEERIDPLYYLKYGPLTLATVRPETKFGDTALAVHPNDERYKKYINQTIKYEGLLGPARLTVIADEYVNPAFGTGVVKITPAHDSNDFEVGERHHLPAIEVIDQYNRLTDKTGPYAGLKVKEARQKVAADLKSKGLLVKVDPNYSHTVGSCYKCGTVIEPRVLPQWFIAMTKTGRSGKNLRDDAVKSVQEKQLKFVTTRFETIFYRWMDNLRDWNISRQIVWGIQLPVWYCQCRRGQPLSAQPDGGNNCDCPPIITDGSTPEVCSACGEKNLIRDPDVFDTWFSSGQWPILALQVQKSDDFNRFYPTAVMETAYDILFFWVARMLMLGLYFTGQPPFKDIYIHGLVRDKDRQKMSKSKGNVIDPLGVAEQYGSDAVRLALVFGTSAGNDIVIAEDKIKGMRNFANKLWNISRFIQLNLAGQTFSLAELTEVSPQTQADQAMQAGLVEVQKAVSANLESYQFHLAAEKLYDFTWHRFADIYLEASKIQLNEPAGTAAATTRRLLLRSLVIQLALLHPFMPFVTEAIYQSLPISDKSTLLMTANWPTV